MMPAYAGTPGLSSVLWSFAFVGNRMQLVVAVVQFDWAAGRGDGASPAYLNVSLYTAAATDAAARAQPGSNAGRQRQHDDLRGSGAERIRWCGSLAPCAYAAAVTHMA
jgi:hypothetical protein